MNILHRSDTVDIPAEWGVDDIVQVFHDRIYGPIPITRFAYALLLTPQVQRINYISHLGLLDGMTRLGASASRFEHVLGVYLLVLIISRLPELRPFRNLLIAAAIGHDNGSAPYVHSVEGVQIKVLKANHEEVLMLPYFRESEFARVLEEWGVDYSEFCLLVQGKHPNSLLNAVIHGQHDLDRCDGTCRYALAWRRVSEGLPYDPAEIALSFEVRNDGLVLQEQPGCKRTLEMVMRDFLETRQDIFDKIHDPLIEGPEILLARAVELAWREQKIKPKFFTGMNDHQATEFLLRKCNGDTKVLVEKTMSDQHPVRIYQKRFFRPLPSQVDMLMSFDWRQRAADQLAERLGLPIKDAYVNSGRFKGIVDMRTTPIFARDGRPIVLPSKDPYWFAHAYLSPEYAEKHDQAAGEIMDELLGI